MFDSGEELQIKLARKYLKMKIIEDNLTFRDHEDQKSHVYDLLSRTIEAGESNSALVIGPRGSGKTTLINNVLWNLSKNRPFQENSILVKLNGQLHTDDKLALKAITSQMSLDNAIGDRVFGSFSENLSFLLSCLKSGQDKHCKSVLFILEEFDLFCYTHGSQTLLYNLFDIAQSKQAPICVIGVTCRLDVIELLEKRVKSRFSHRQIFIFPYTYDVPEADEENQSILNKRVRLFVDLLSLPTDVKFQTSSKKKNSNYSDSCSDSDDQDTSEKEIFAIPNEVLLKCRVDFKDFKDLDPIFVSFWNENIKILGNDEIVHKSLQRMFDIDVSEQSFRNFMMQLICKLSNAHPQLEAGDVLGVSQNFINIDDKLSILLSLSVLEMSLIVAMKHQMEIFDGQPMNFEMVYNRYSKFANCNSSAQSIPRAVILKAFEHLRAMELISPMRGEGANIGYVQKEYQLYRLLVTGTQITEAIKQYRTLPTELSQWALSSLI